MLLPKARRRLDTGSEGDISRRSSRNTDYKSLSVSPGGFSWYRKISEHRSRSVDCTVGSAGSGLTSILPVSTSRMRVVSEDNLENEGEISSSPHRRPFHYTGSQCCFAELASTIALKTDQKSFI